MRSTFQTCCCITYRVCLHRSGAHAAVYSHMEGGTCVAAAALAFFLALARDFLGLLGILSCLQ
jgi:hypothetical protein